ncbi:MAG: amidohydrolase family protein [Chitinophagaceae bacterium]|nr:amidohydrolase family protein [Chitinophagaceae bacterium]
MGYRKFNARQLFTGNEMLDDSQVLITKTDGSIEEIVPINDAGDDIQIVDGLLTPGFINCHSHLELSHLKGVIPEGTGMKDFVLAVMEKRHVTDEQIFFAINNAEDELIKNGIVAVGDICNTLTTLPQKQRGRIYYHNFIEVSGFIPAGATTRFNRSVDFFNAFASLSQLPIESNSIVPHAPYSVSTELFKLILDFPGNHIISMHNQESKAEENLFLNREGEFIDLYNQLGLDIGHFQATHKNSLQSVYSNFRSNQRLILVHNVTTNENDIAFLQKSDTRINRDLLHFCLCPNANEYIGNGLPNINVLANSGYDIVIGTDSLASNHQLSILEELKTLQEHESSLSLPKILKWATLNGAKALEAEQLFGSFEKGKRPGVVSISNIEQQRLTKASKVTRLL